jgi:hypothetical protein
MRPIMAAINDLDLILHNIRVKLYPNYLPAAKGRYLARTDSDKTVNVRDICTIMVTRAGFDGSIDTLHDYVIQFFDEMAYQLCDGFTVNSGYFTIRPNIGGTFDSADEIHGHNKHPVSFTFNPLAKLRKLANNIKVVVEGIADTSAYIDQIEDVEEHLVNSGYMAGHAVAVHGHKIKIAGDDPVVGLYFVPANDPSHAVKAARILENNPSRLLAIAPSTGFNVNKIEIRRQFAGSGSILLTAPRVITSPFTVEEV